jgi:hypothetical protein
MKIFTYPPVLKFLYRYGNIPLTILLLLYVFPLIINIDDNLSYLIPVIIVFLLIYFLNRHYLHLYKILPFRIEADEEKLVTSDYTFSSKTVTIYFKDISELKGGVFEGKLRGTMKLIDGRTKHIVGFYQNINDAPALQTIILSKVSKELYEKTLENIKSRRKFKTDQKK